MNNDLQRLIPAMKEMEAEDLVAKGENIRRRHRVVGAVSTVAAVAILGLAVGQLVRTAPTVASTPSSTQSVARSTVPGQCPHLIPEPSPSNMVRFEDGVDMILWQERSYLAQGVGSSPGELQFKVRCDLGAVKASGYGHISLPWPDKSATDLRVDTPVHAVAGVSERCALTVKNSAGEWQLYRALPIPEGC